MTAQISDRLTYDGKEYSVAAIENDWPFVPQDHGFEPVATSTACWRGYYSSYAIQDRTLVLTKLTIGLGGLSRLKPPRWRDVHPTRCEDDQHSWVYAGVNLPVPYTGGVVVGHGLLGEFYVHMGFQRPHCYQDVRELLFETGELRTAIDHSERMEQARERLRIHGLDRFKPMPDDVKRFIADAFSVSYVKKWR